jgi:hypothetical protein
MPVQLTSRTGQALTGRARAGILAPLHAIAGDAAGQGSTLFVRTTVYNLPPDSWVLWVDVAAFYLYSLGMFRFIKHFQVHSWPHSHRTLHPVIQRSPSLRGGVAVAR